MKLPLVFLVFLGIFSGFSQDSELSPAAQVLFKDVTCKLNAAEMNALFDTSMFALAPNGEQFYFKDDSYSAEFPFNIEVYPLDLNSDGIEEIAMVFGNAATSGAAGSSGILFIKNANSVYESNFGFPGMYAFLATGNLNFPDVCIAGPGFEFPVWRWNGKSYEMHRTISDSEMQQLSPAYFQQASALYLGK
jgi:hypothetical protein